MKIAVPDLVSNSYFPAIAAVALGHFKDEGLDLDLELVFPVDKAYAALRDGDLAFVGGSAHSVPAAFPEWRDARLIAGLAQGTYWFLVMRPDLAGARGDVSVVKGRRIGAAPMVDLGLKGLLVDAGIDLVRDGVTIMPIPGSLEPGVSFGVNAAKALEAGLIDGFWANGMGAAVAVQRGIGTIVLDARRGDGPSSAFGFTMGVLVTTAAIIDERPDLAASAVRAIVKTQQALKHEVGRAALVGQRYFPAFEAGLIVPLIERDLPYYDPAISPATFASIAAFSQRMGLAQTIPSYDEIVPAAVRPLWV